LIADIHCPSEISIGYEKRYLTLAILGAILVNGITEGWFFAREEKGDLI